MIPVLTFFLLSPSPDILDLDIDKAVDYALINNPEIKQLEIELEKADLRTDESISNFYPSISASGYYAYITDVPVIDFGGVPLSMGQHENYDVSLSLHQVIFAWGKIYDAYRLSNIGRDIAKLSFERKQQEIRYSVTESFYGLLVLKEMANLVRESYGQLQRHEEAVRKRYEAGLVPQFELLRSQVQVANLKPRVIEAENGLKLAKNGFQMLLGMDLNREFEVTGELGLTEEEFVLEQLVEEGLKNRIELRNLRNVEKMSEIGRSIIRRTNLPVVVAGAVYDYKKPSGFTDNEWGSNITFNIGFSMPIFSGFKTLSQYKQASLDIVKAKLAREQLENGIVLDVKNSFYNFQTAKEAITAAQENLVQAEKALEIIDTRYKNGLATNLEYLDAQLAHMQAKTNHLNALKDFYTARASIYRAIGKEQ